MTRRLLLGGIALGGIGAVGYAASQAMKPPPEKLKLSGYELTFSEEFNDPSFSLDQFVKRWYPHTPWWGDFGDAQFADYVLGFPLTLDNGSLRIEASKGADGKWRSGLISTVNHQGLGFAQRYGYFEIRAKLPQGPGVWPAFWLDSWYPTMTDPSIEIDVFEYYGKFPNEIHSTVTIWPKDGTLKQSNAHIHRVKDDMTLSNEFHTYGVSVDPDWIIMFLDGVETWRTSTPPQHKHDMAILIDLALGSGWPIDQTPNPSYLLVDYVRVYKKTAPELRSAV